MPKLMTILSAFGRYARRTHYTIRTRRYCLSAALRPHESEVGIQSVLDRGFSGSIRDPYVNTLMAGVGGKAHTRLGLRNWSGLRTLRANADPAYSPAGA